MTPKNTEISVFTVFYRVSDRLSVASVLELCKPTEFVKQSFYTEFPTEFLPLRALLCVAPCRADSGAGGKKKKKDGASSMESAQTQANARIFRCNR